MPSFQTVKGGESRFLTLSHGPNMFLAFTVASTYFSFSSESNICIFQSFVKKKSGSDCQSVDLHFYSDKTVLDVIYYKEKSHLYYKMQLDAPLNYGLGWNNDKNLLNGQKLLDKHWRLALTDWPLCIPVYFLILKPFQILKTIIFIVQLFSLL